MLLHHVWPLSCVRCSSAAHDLDADVELPDSMLKLTALTTLSLALPGNISRIAATQPLP